MNRKLALWAVLGVAAAMAAPAATVAAFAQPPSEIQTEVQKDVETTTEIHAAPKPAAKLLAVGMRDSSKHHKVTMVIFHATWCGWCKKLEAAMAQPEIKKIFDKNYTIVTVDVLENGPKVAEFENPGGKQYMTDLGGEKSGLPFYAWIDKDGKKLADSNVMPKAANIGYPGEPAEIEAFMDLIKKTAPSLTDADAKTLHDYFVANAPKSNAH